MKCYQCIKQTIIYKYISWFCAPSRSYGTDFERDHNYKVAYTRDLLAIARCGKLQPRDTLVRSHSLSSVPLVSFMQYKIVTMTQSLLQAPLEMEIPLLFYLDDFC